MNNEQNSGQGRGHNLRAQFEPLHQGGNNNVYPPNWTERYQDATSYNQLDEAAQNALLRDKGHLFGVRIDSNDGPRRGARQVAQYTSKLQPHVQEANNIDSEVILTDNVRETNYVHQGWSLSALPVRSPWSLSRIARNNHQVNRTSRSITKCVMVQKLRIDISLDDISPVPDLERDFQGALGQPTLLEKSDAAYRVFERWGDVIPLVFDIGVALAVTDFELTAKIYLEDQSYLGLQKLSMSTTARPSTRGGDPTALRSEDNIRSWLGHPVPLSKWEQIRIIKTAPITAILSNELQSQLAKLHQSLTTYCPATTNVVASSGASFDGTNHSFKTISKVAIYLSGNYVRSLYLTYTTDPSPVRYGAENRANHEFTLQSGEHITDVLLWKNCTGVCGIQLSTNYGRVSNHFGSDGGSPVIMRSSGGYLSAFSGTVQGGIIYGFQTIWRHDVQGSWLSGSREFSRYFGGTGGRPFNDWSFVQHSDSAHIAHIRIKCGKYIDGIQITYRDFGPERNPPKTRQANYHGGAGGNECFFDLGPNEHIVAVTGRQKTYIDQLRFETNKGRTSSVFGGGGGDRFRCQAPKTRDGKATRLHYICGKSAGLLDGLVLVWAPL